METVYSVLVKQLKKLEVTHVFGVPAKTVKPLIVELDNQGVQFISSRHEGGAGYQAVGYSLRTRKLGVAIATAGCGGTNMLTAVAQAKLNHVPLLFITGQPSVKIGRSMNQDSSIFGTDLMKMFDPVTVFNAKVERPDTFQSLFIHAIEKAFEGQGGPVHLNIPFDVFNDVCSDFECPLPVFSKMVSGNLQTVIDKINQAKRPVILAGEEIHSTQTYDELEQFANRFQIPVMTLIGGKGTIPTHHPLSLGTVGLGGSTESESYLSNGTDLMIVLGSELSDLALAGFKSEWFPKEVIHFGYDSTYMGKSIPVLTTKVLGDMKSNLQQILTLSEGIEKRESVEIALNSVPDDFVPMEGRMSAMQTMKVLRSVLPEESMVFSDAGSHTFYANQHFEVKKAGTFFFDAVLSSMGTAISNAIGAKCSEPNLTVACITGDGCMFMHGTEVSTAVNYQLPVIFIVLNNGQLDMVQKGMSLDGKAVGVVFDHPLHVTQFAKSMGADAFRCHNKEELISAVQFALANKNATVVEVMVDPAEVPPTAKRG